MAKIISAFSLLLPFLVLPNMAFAQAGYSDGGTTPTASVVEVPIRISLDWLFDLAEREMPLEAGDWRRWRKAYGVMARYQAWRGPLFISMQGDELVVQAHVRYWIQARKNLVGKLALKSSCGLDEAPRQAIIGVRIRLGWRADWTIWPQFRVMPTRFLGKCEMTIANIDVTPLVAREFQKQLKEKMYGALMALAPRLHAIRRRAEQNWLVLQQPVELWKDHWLVLNPQAIALSPLVGQGNWVDTRLALWMAPEIAIGGEPVSQYRALPPLMQFYPQPAGLNLQLALDLSYEDLSQAVTKELAADDFNIGGHRGSIEAITLSGQGQQVSGSVRLSGEVAGNMEIKASMGFNPETQQFELSDLNYTTTLQDVWLEADARLLYNHIRKVLENSANQHLQQKMGQWRQRLRRVFERITPEDMQLDLTSLQFLDVQLNMAKDNIQMNGLLSGYIVLAP